MAKAGFDPAQAITFWKNMDVYNPGSSHAALSGHPSNEARIENIRSHLNEVRSVIAPANSECSL